MIETPVGKVGLLICWDVAFPEAFRELISKGAELIIIPTFCKLTCYLCVWVRGWCGANVYRESV